jgi:beta-xylosidase
MNFKYPIVLIVLIVVTEAWAQPADPGPAYTPMTPEQHRAKFNYSGVQPLFDTPMRDCAIARGPDGVHYLTGTTGTSREDGTVDFAINDGIGLWRSDDLKAWDDLGIVAPLSLLRAKVEDLRLLRAAQYENEFQGFIAPELHFIKGGVYLTYALWPCGTGLLKSKSGKPEGPYEDVGLITRRGKDASLFADDDGKVYWVFGGGWIARMNDAMTALAEEPRLIQPSTPGANTPGAEILQVGTGGAFLFKKDAVYHLLAAGIHGRLGVPCYDTFVATANSLGGPWTQRKVAVAHGGQSTMFEDPGGQWYATFSGVDSRAALRERPAIVPVDWVDSVHYFYPKNESWPWKRPQVITEAWGWEHARPLSDLSYRDPHGVYGRDGYFYVSGLHNPGSHGRRVELLRGKDLTGSQPWDAFPIPGFETVDRVPWFTEQGGGFAVGVCKPFFAADTFWISLSVRGGKRLLRSQSGTMQGPWKVAVECPTPAPTAAIGYWCSHPFQDHRGDMYGYLNETLWPMNEHFTQPDAGRKPPVEAGYEPVSDKRLQGYVRESSDGSHLLRGDAPIGHVYWINGHYLMMGGCGWHGEYRRFGTYDSCVYWAHEIGGPWRPNHSVLPHSGNSGLFQDDNGTWWHVGFANDNFLPDNARLRCLPLEITWNGNGYDIQPKHKQQTPYVHREVSIVPDTVAEKITSAYPLVKLPEDIILQSPAITPVEEAGATVYFLTGTAASKASGFRVQVPVEEDGGIVPKPVTRILTPDFRNNDGVYLWRSTDLQKWTALGKVFDLARLNRKGSAAAGWNSPFAVHFSPPDSLEPRYDRAVVTPKLYRIGDEYWIVCSASRQQVCLLKSQSGRPEGPYDMEGPPSIHNSRAGILDSGSKSESRTDAYHFAYDPSLFVEDGAIYLVFGPGWIAKLQDDPGRGLAERPHLLEIEGPELYAGKGRCSLRKQAGKYVLTALTEWNDTVQYTADALYGPYGNPRLVLAQAGHVGMFESNEGEWTVVLSHH